MLFATNPQALNTIIDEGRRDHGQYVATFIAEVSPVVDNERVPTRFTLGSVLRMLLST